MTPCRPKERPGESSNPIKVIDREGCAPERIHHIGYGFEEEPFRHDTGAEDLGQVERDGHPRCRPPWCGHRSPSPRRGFRWRWCSSQSPGRRRSLRDSSTWWTLQAHAIARTHHIDRQFFHLQICRHNAHRTSPALSCTFRGEWLCASPVVECCTGVGYSGARSGGRHREQPTLRNILRLVVHPGRMRR